MNPEQFSQLLDMVNQAGNGAFIIALLWVLKSYVSGFFITLILSIGGLIIYRAIRKDYMLDHIQRLEKKVSELERIERYKEAIGE